MLAEEVLTLSRTKGIFSGGGVVGGGGASYDLDARMVLTVYALCPSLSHAIDMRAILIGHMVRVARRMRPALPRNNRCGVRSIGTLRPSFAIVSVKYSV